MGLRFRKSISIGKSFRINLSKSGIGYSYGGKGYRVTRTAKGTTRTTFTLPGTGLSYVHETKAGNRHSNSVPVNSTSASHDALYDTNCSNTVKGHSSVMKSKPGLLKTIGLWFLTGIFFSGIVSNFPHWSSFLCILVTLLILPISSWQDRVSSILRGKLKLIITVIIALLALYHSPSTIDAPSKEYGTLTSPTPTVEVAIAAQSVTASTERVTPTQSATHQPTSIPTRSPTPTPTAKPTATPTKRPMATPTPNPNRTYILNTKSRVFHEPSCRSVKIMSEGNKLEFNGLREDVIKQGYSSCGICHP